MCSLTRCLVSSCPQTLGKPGPNEMPEPVCTQRSSSLHKPNSPKPLVPVSNSSITKFFFMFYVYDFTVPSSLSWVHTRNKFSSFWQAAGNEDRVMVAVRRPNNDMQFLRFLSRSQGTGQLGDNCNPVPAKEEC